MITVVLLFVFAIVGVGCFLVAWGANQRRRARMGGQDAVKDQQVTRPRATPKVE